MGTSPQYPFTPRSNRHLIPGQFWPLPLSDGRFACGRVLQLPPASEHPDRRSFLGGLMDWVGNAPPRSADLAGGHIMEQGVMHIRVFTHQGSQVIGHRPLEVDNLAPARWLSAAADSPSCILMEGLTPIRPATAEERRFLPTYSSWGFRVVYIAAERHFVGPNAEG